MDKQLSNQRFYLLSRMAAAKTHSLTGAALKKLPKAPREELGLDPDTAAAVMAGLAAENLVTEKRRGKSVTFQLAEAGSAYLKTLPPYPPPPKVEPAHNDAQLLGWQKAFALFTFFVAKANKLTAAELKRKLTSAKAKPVAFDAPTIAWVAWLLAGEGSVNEHKRGKAVSYELAPQGVERLASAEQHPTVELTLSGAALTALTAAARNAGTAGDAAAEPIAAQGEEEKADAALVLSPSPPAPPRHAGNGEPTAGSDGGGDFVLSAFRELLRERYAHTGLVPIHEVRQAIASRHGEAAARHESMDGEVRRLRREGRLRMVSIADQSRATSEQLGQSIPGENEIFFYLGEPL